MNTNFNIVKKPKKEDVERGMVLCKPKSIRRR